MNTQPVNVFGNAQPQPVSEDERTWWGEMVAFVVGLDAVTISIGRDSDGYRRATIHGPAGTLEACWDVGGRFRAAGVGDWRGWDQEKVCACLGV